MNTWRLESVTGMNSWRPAEQEGKGCLGVRSPGCGFGDAEDSGLTPVLPHDVLDHLLDAVRGGASPVPDGTWTHWPLATDGPGGMLTAPASRHQARQAKLATQEDALPGSDGPTPSEGRRRRDRHATRATWRATLTGCALHPLRRLTSIRDGTAPGGGDSLADPTMAARTVSRRGVAFPTSQVAAQPGWGWRPPACLVASRAIPAAPRRARRWRQPRAWS